MRRVIATLALSLAVFGTAACSDTPTTEAGPGSSAAPSASAAAAPAGTADKKTTCAAYEKAEMAAKVAMLATLGKAMDAITDESKQQELIGELKKTMVDFGTALTAAAADSADAEVKAALEANIAALTAATTAIETAAGDFDKATDAIDAPEFEQAGKKLEALCAA
ncbi:hypothetical protein QEZ54_07870 [Catellatospora sp. KI3]|uniref:hypothetical protein n=1 Tax=Catellatospora sp. KI3 TaxID=3041620 RepID=UPI0024824938|nr:hypothetical protein [Catellatospora sp. KI3]MDI1460878.1 hypothetical protein [Catellatospora sp. KI3]